MKLTHRFPSSETEQEPQVFSVNLAGRAETMSEGENRQWEV